MKTCPRCGRNFDSGWMACYCGSKLPDITVDDLVVSWLQAEPWLFEAAHDSPDLAWLAILKLLQSELSQSDISALAVGPLDLLFRCHGDKIIDSAEIEAYKNPMFRQLLLQLEENGISKDIWRRIDRALSDTRVTAA